MRLSFGIFSVINVISILTGSSNSRRYWSDLKTKLRQEGGEVYDNIVQLKMISSDGKKYNTDCFSTEGLLRLKPRDVPDTYADVDDLVEQFGHKPSMSVKQGVENFAVWYKIYSKG